MTSAPEYRPVITDGFPCQVPDLDPTETQEWVESLDAVVDQAGPTRARALLLRVLERARVRPGEAGSTGQTHEGDKFAVLAGTQRNFRTTGNEPLMLYTIYSPLEHAVDAVESSWRSSPERAPQGQPR